MLAETDLFRQEFEIAAQHLESLRQQWALLPDQPGAPHPALEGMAEALLAVKQAHAADLSRQNQACADRCQGLETELAHYRDLFENAPHARLQTDLNATIQAVNTPASILLRASQDALVGEQLAAFLPEQVRETLAEHLAQLQAGEALHGWEVCLQPASGDRVEVSLDAVPGPEHRLVAVQWSVRDISRQVQAEEALRQNEHLLRSFVEQSFDGIALTDEQGQVIEWNRAMESITGLPATAIVGRPIWEVQLLLDDASDPEAGLGEQVKAGILELLRSGQAPWLGQLMERTYVLPDGASRVVQGAVFPFRTRKGFMLGSISRDVTDLKRTEEALRQSESKYRLLVESLHDGVWVVNEVGDTVFVNPAMAQLLGYTVDEMVGVHPCGFVSQKDVHAVQTGLERCRQGITENLDFELCRKDGTRLLANLHTTPIFDTSGAYAGALASVRDITKEREANDERERLLAQVLEEQGRTAILSTQTQRQADELGAFLNAIPDPVAVWDTQGDVIRANPAALSLGIGTAKSGMVEVAAQLEVRHPNGRPISAEELPVARALRGEVIRDEAEILVSPDGEEHEILVSVAPVFSDGAIVACVVVSHDITDKRWAEKEREQLLAENRSQREFLERLVEAAPVGIAVLHGPEHRYELVNPYYQRITGVPDRPMVGRTIVEVIPDLVNRRMPQLMDEVYHTGMTVSTRAVKLSFGPGREETYWNMDQVPLHGPEGSVEGILVLAQEVTEEVKSRERIEALSVQARRQAAEMAAVFTALVEPVMVFDAQGRILTANPAAIEALGFDPANLPESELARRLTVRTPDGRPIPPADLVAARALLGESVRDVYQFLVTTGGERAVVAGAAPIGAGDQILGAVVAWHDITELRRAEAARHKSEELFRTVIENSRDGINMLDLETGRYIFMSPAQQKLTGFDPQELNDLPAEEAFERVHPDDREISISQQKAIVEGPDEGMTVEYRWKIKSGEYRWFSDSRKLVRDEKGRAIALVGVNRDITDQKRADEALQASEEKYRLLFQNMAEGFVLYELLYDEQGQPADWRVLEANDAYTHHTGVTHDRIVGRCISDLFPAAIPEYLPRFVAVVATQTAVDFETHAEATDRYQHVVTFPAGGHRFASIIVDISERKRAEEALRASEEKFATVFRFSPDAIGIARVADGVLFDVNDSFTEMLGYARSEVIGRTWRELQLVPVTDEGARVEGLFSAKGLVADLELDLTTRSGNLVTMLLSLVPITVSGEHCVLVIAHDISKRKESEEALRRAYAELAVGVQERSALEERQRLARELHDSVSQALYGVSLGINTALALFDSDQTKVIEALHYALSLTHGGLAEMRALIFELRPESLAQEGLVVALSKLVEASHVRHGFEVELGLCDEPDAPLAVKEALYRIAQEALHNAVKHAHPSRLDVRLTCAPDSLMLEVCDNGEGFDPLAAYPGHLGLRSMRERAQLIGGTLDIVSAQSCGTQIRVQIPLAAPE